MKPNSFRKDDSVRESMRIDTTVLYRPGQKLISGSLSNELIQYINDSDAYGYADVMFNYFSVILNQEDAFEFCIKFSSLIERISNVTIKEDGAMRKNLFLIANEMRKRYERNK